MLLDRCLSICLSVTLVYCGQTVRWIKIGSLWNFAWKQASALATLCQILGPSSELGPSPKGRSPHPQFLAHVCCGQTAGWIKIPLGMEVSLGPGDIVLNRGPSSPLKRGTAPFFGPCLLRPNGRPSQLLLSTCLWNYHKALVKCKR